MSATHSFLAPLSGQGIISVKGPEQIKYLQGQVTCDMNSNTAEQALLGCHCDAKGKMWSSFISCHLGEQKLLITDASALPASLAELKKYGVFSQVDIDDVSSGWQLFGGAGEQLEAIIEDVFDALPTGNLSQSVKGKSAVIALQGAETRYLLLLDAEMAPQVTDAYPKPLAEESLWNLTQIQAGWPSLQVELQQDFIPQMMNFQALGAISFTKGCYMGQEVVARSKYLGKNKRSAFILSGPTQQTAGAGNDLEVDLGEGRWRRAGTVVNVVTDHNEQWALAVLPKDTEAIATLRLKQAPEQTFSIKPLPYSLED